MRYQALNRDNAEIRLLELLGPALEGDSGNADVHCRLVTASLLSKPEYDALSYCWGTLPASSWITVDGERVPVTASLAMALRELRRREIATLWVDFLCISQSDNDEKSQQVLMMDKVFGQARTVYAWLFPAPPCVEYILYALKEVATNTTLGEDLSHAMDTGFGDLLNEVCANPYWRRVWIIQELAKAKNVLLLWNHHDFPWDILCEALASKHLDYFLTKPQREVFSALQAFRLQEKNININLQRLTLLEALVQSRHALATDARDKIFALLNLTSDGQDLVPLTNYSKTTCQIFQEVASGMIVRQQNTATILLAKRKAKPTVENLPTWVPDWSSLPTNLPRWILTGVENGRATDSFEIMEDGRKLTLPCKQIGTVLATLRRPDPLTSESCHAGDVEVEGGEFDIIAAVDTFPLDVAGNTDLMRAYKVCSRHTLDAQDHVSIQAMGVFVRFYLEYPPDTDLPAFVDEWISDHRQHVLPSHFVKRLLLDIARTVIHTLESLAACFFSENDRAVFAARPGALLLNGDRLSLAISTDLDFFVSSCDPKAMDRIVEVPNCSLPLMLGPVTEHYYEYLGEVVQPQSRKFSSGERRIAEVYYIERITVI